MLLFLNLKRKIGIISVPIYIIAVKSYLMHVKMVYYMYTETRCNRQKMYKFYQDTFLSLA